MSLANHDSVAFPWQYLSYLVIINLLVRFLPETSYSRAH